MTAGSRLRVLILIAARNLRSHGARTGLVGSILALGTALVMVGTSLLDSVEAATEASITESLAGDLQVYSTEGRDALALFGGGFMGIDDIGRIERAAEVESMVREVPGVEAAVAMGLDFATISQPGVLESSLAELRDAHYSKDAGALRAGIKRVRELAADVVDELERRREISDDEDGLRQAIEDARHATTDAYWSEFLEDPLGGLEFLDTRVAPSSVEGGIVFLRYLGTDVPRFVAHFDRFELLEGEVTPELSRGLMFNQKFYEQRIKHEIARYIDRVHRMVVEQELTLEGDSLLRTIVGRIPTQWRRLARELSQDERERLVPTLRDYLGRGPDADLEALLTEFLTVDDVNIEERSEWFYAHIAPLIDLYSIDVGDVVTIRAYTRSGYLKAINVPVFGVFRFRGLDGSDLAGGHNLMDLVTFRELYGLMTPAKARELESMRAEAGVRDVDRDDAEDALFGGDVDLVQEVGAADVTEFDEFSNVDLESLRDRAGRAEAAHFSQQDLDQGMALNMAVVVEDGADPREVEERLQRKFDEAGAPLQVVSWQEASGLVGQFVTVIRLVMYIALAIIFAAALVIINNSTVTATLERIPEIGTLRAIGAQRSSILIMFLAESAMLALLAGFVGVIVGAVVLGALGQTGIPAWHQVLFFLFGGPRLYPEFGLHHALYAVASVGFVTTVSALYPANLAASVQPIEAMRDRD